MAISLIVQFLETLWGKLQVHGHSHTLPDTPRPNNSRSRTGKQEAWRSEGTVVATRDQRGSSPWRILYQQLLCERDNAGRAVPLPVRSGRGGKPPPGRSFGESARHSGSSAMGAPAPPR